MRLTDRVGSLATAVAAAAGFLVGVSASATATTTSSTTSTTTTSLSSTGVANTGKAAGDGPATSVSASVSSSVSTPSSSSSTSSTASASSSTSSPASISVTQSTSSHRTTNATPSSKKISGSASLSPPVYTPSNATCEARTINYITHQLPQQCLLTAWMSDTANATGTVTGVEGKVTAGPGGENESAVRNETELAGHHFVTVVNGTTVTVTPSAAEGAVPRTATTTSTSSARVEDENSDLDDVSFMSFEEWKKQMLEKEEQAQPGAGAKRSGTTTDDDKEGGSYQAMESGAGMKLNFESEIGAGGKPQATGSTTTDGATSSDGTKQADAQKKSRRSKDAGKTCKERFNYASFDAGATVMKTNPGAKNAKALLVENKDSYMLTPCSAEDKHVVVELSDEIFIDTVVLANFEFFSSVFRQFSVYASDRYPPKGDRWTHLGTYEARNTREIQAFLVEEPIIWARYIKIEFLNHWGHEFYCPVSILRVHGKSQLEDYRLQEEAASGVLDADDEEETITAEAVADAIATQTAGKANTSAAEPAVKPPVKNPADTKIGEMISPWAPQISEGAVFIIDDVLEVCTRTTETTIAPSLNQSIHIPTGSPASSASFLNVSSILSESSLPLDISSKISQSTASMAASSTSLAKDASATSSNSGKPTVATGKSSSSTSISSKSTSTSASASPSPSSQESFFKTVSRRLQLLESNSTLSLQYIEDQSKILRDAFGKVEKKHLAKTHAFLEALNQTVLEELRNFRQQYDQIWQSTIIELETQRDRSHSEMLAVSTRLNVLADEVVFQKRMAMVQSVLLLLCLGLIIFSRGSGGYIDLSIIQGMRAKSPTAEQFADDGIYRRRSIFGRRRWNRSGHIRTRSDESVDSVDEKPEDVRPETYLSGSDEDEPVEIQSDMAPRIHITDDSSDMPLNRGKRGSETTWQDGNTILEESSLPSTPITASPTPDASPNGKYPLLRTQSSPASVTHTHPLPPPPPDVQEFSETDGDDFGSPDSSIEAEERYRRRQEELHLQSLPSPPPEELRPRLLSPSKKPLPALPRHDTA